MMIISPGVSVVAAGLVSGLCFIIINGLRRGRAASADKEAKANQVADDGRCACCLKPFLVGRGVQCGECGARACRKGCSRWDTPDNAWYCLFCHQRRLWLRRNEKWFETFGGLSADHEAAAHRFSTAKSQVLLGEADSARDGTSDGTPPECGEALSAKISVSFFCYDYLQRTGSRADYAGVGPGVGLAAGGEEDAGDSVERVREFVEKIVDSLVGDVDEIPIDRLYDHQAYDQLVENYKEPLAGVLARLAISLQLSISNKPAADTPTMAHAALRDLVERAVEEAKKLPGLGSSDAGRSADREPSDISEQTYEDLLATAILNKVIEKYQHERVDGNSNTLHDKSSPRPKYITSEIEVGLDEGVEEGSSSLEPLSQDEYSSDCSAPAPKYSLTRQEPLSLTIEEHIEEVTTTYTSDEEEERDNGEADRLDFRKAHRVPFPEFGMDIIDPSQESSEETPDETPTHVDLVTPVESWEENWLFQKKKMQAQSEPVSMLVPNPSEDFKPLIGDREADDTSDLSDCSAQSDDEIEEELLEAINNVALKPPGTPEGAEVQPLLKVEELVHVTSNGTKIEETRMRTEFGKTTITIGEGNSKNLPSHVQTKEIHANGITRVQLNGNGEGNVQNRRSQGTEIKLGIEDMLVFHSNEDGRSSSGQKRSTEFIEREKSTAHLDEKIGADGVNIPGSITRDESETVQIKESRSEQQNPPTNKSAVTVDPARIAEPQIEININVGNGVEWAQVTRDLKITNDLQIISRDKDQFSNLDDDLESKNVPRTPTSTPLRLSETIDTETGPRIDPRSLDEKLVSIETKVDTKPNSLDETTVDSYVQKTAVVRSSSTSVVTNSTEVKDHVVKARLILVGNGIEDSNEIDHHNEDGAQQEREYTEHYATATQRHLDSLTRPISTHLNDVQTSNDHHDDDIPPPIPSTPPPIARLKQCRRAASLAAVEVDVDGPETVERKRVEVDLFLATPPRPGTIAEREHKKWENAAPIENNPYSEENIQKRLWQRQYSRKLSSDISAGESSEAPKTAGTPLQVVLGAGQPDAKRYGRDYYINDAKRASGERARRSAMSNSERPNSSLSQNSGSYDDDLEPQEQTLSEEPEMSNTVTEVKSKVSTWQQNNIADSNQNVVLRNRHRVETTIHLGSGPDQVDGNEVQIKSIGSSISEVDNSWEGQNAEDLLENVRRNSKNELNAKLNNQEDPERITVSDARKSLVNESQKSINRIDLKAYGFENEIKSKSNSVTKISDRRVVNKLDLSSFGYDSELKRIQSTGQIDAKLNNEIIAKPRIVKMKTKLNLTEHHADSERSKSSHNLVEYVEASGDFDKTKSTEILKEDNNLAERFHDFGRMISAKSMPNVTKIEHYSQNLSGARGYKDEEHMLISRLTTKTEKFNEEERLRQEMIKASAKSQGVWKSESTLLAGEKTSGANDFSSEDELDGLIVTNKYTQVLTKKEIFEKTSELNTSSSGSIDNNLPMPSVRRLAQTFIEPPTNKPCAPPRVLKTYGNVRKERPTTPEVHIIETPRQMHSLTARSISREFREGLRQIPNKITSSTTSHVITEQSIITVQNKPEVVPSEIDSSNVEAVATAPGKLKNNIKFWEQLQKQS